MCDAQQVLSVYYYYFTDKIAHLCICCSVLPLHSYPISLLMCRLDILMEADFSNISHHEGQGYLREAVVAPDFTVASEPEA